MNIGLYFGSFNPVHIGHLIIAKYISQHTNLDQVWFIVSPQNPFKESAALLNEYQRLHLVRLAIDGEDDLKASDIEFHLPRPSYTVDTLAYLGEKYPQHRFSVIMGSDSYQNLPRWKNADVIMRNYPLFVYRRPGFEIKDPGDSVIQLNAPLLQISATEIRNMIREGKSIRYLVSDIVQQEIENTGYYR